MHSKFEDEARSLRKQEVRRERLCAVYEPHVASLNAFVDELRESRRKQIKWGAYIPYFDPLDGGKDARCLFLFEAPGGGPVSSGFISRNNDDPTAARFFRLNRDAVAYDRRLTVSWNVVPWVLGRDTEKGDVEEGLPYLESLLTRGLLPDLKVVVLFGKSLVWAAEDTVGAYPRPLKIIKTYHPSPRNSAPSMEEDMVMALSEAKEYCRDDL